MDCCDFDDGPRGVTEMDKNASGFWRLVPAALGLLCAVTLTATLVTCSGFADRTLSDWVPATDMGTRTSTAYTLISETSDDAPELLVVPPKWVVGVATEDAGDDDLSRSLTHLTYTFEGGNVVLTYAADSVDDFLEWQLSEDTIITSHLFGGRYTNIEVGKPKTSTLGGHEVSWGTYAFDDEYGRRNVAYVSAAEVEDDEMLAIVASETLEDGAEPFLSEQVLDELWQAVTW